MKQKSISALQTVAGLIIFLVAGSGASGVGSIVQQFDVFGPRQWLALIAGSLVPGAPRGVLAHLRPRRPAGRDAMPPAHALDDADCVGCTGAA